MRTSIALLPALAAGLVVAAAAAAPAIAQTGFADLDERRAAEQHQAERAARREALAANAAPVVYPKHMDGGERPDIAPVAPPIVYFDQPEEVGSIIVDTQGKKLYYVLPDKKAYAYPISVGRDGFTWSGTERISRITAWPSWTPPPEMHKRVPGLPLTVTGGMKNPQGARALYLGNTIYRIHGTNNDRTVGRANSSGCFRLTNENVVHLASIAKVGAKVRVMHAYNGNVSESAPISSLFSFFSSSEAEKPAAPPPKAKPKPKVVKKAAPATTAAADQPASVVTGSTAPAPAPTAPPTAAAAAAPAATAEPSKPTP